MGILTPPKHQNQIIKIKNPQNLIINKTVISKHQSPLPTGGIVIPTLHTLQRAAGNGPPPQATALDVTELNKNTCTAHKLIHKPCVEPAMPTFLQIL